MSRHVRVIRPVLFPSGGGSPLVRLFTDPLGTLLRWCHQASELFLDHRVISVTAAVTMITLTTLARGELGRWRHGRLTRGARVIEIQVPPRIDSRAAAAFWSNLVGLLRPRLRRWVFGQPHVAFEYRWDGPQLRLQVWVPGTVPASLVARAVEAAWPAARTSLADPGDPAPCGEVAAGGQLRLARPDHHPIATDEAPDPIRALLGAASGIAPGQHAVVQILARPVTGRRLGAAYRAAAQLRGAAGPSPIGRGLDLLTPARTTSVAGRAAVVAAHPERAGEIRAIVDKATAPRFAVTIRYAATTSHLADERASRAWARTQAHALASAFAVFAGRNYFDRHRLRHPVQVLARRRMGRGDLLSVPELAAIAHLPHDPAVPGLARAGAHAVPPSPAIAAGGNGAKLLGDADAGPARPVALRVGDARQHLHLLGATGAGKSTLLGHMVLADAAAGRAAVVIDPRGDLINDLLDRLPLATGERVWLIDPDTTPPPALNVLSGQDRHAASDHVVGIFHRIFADSWGPRTDDILRSTVLTLQQLPGATLADIPRLLTDEPFRQQATRGLRDQILDGFWTWYGELSAEARANATGPVMNKLRHVLLRPFVRHVIGTPGPGLNMTRLLDGGTIMLVRVPKGTLGEDTARLLGSFVVAKVWQTITARAHQSEATRRDASLYVDEAHSFLNLPCGIEDMLAEARAYHLSLTLAHQNLTQFPPAMRDAVAANARNKIVFAVSPRDARELAPITTPNLTEHDLANLGAYQAAARLISGNQEIPAFTFTTRPLPDAIPSRAAHLRAAARANAETTRHPASPPDPRRGHAARRPTGADGPPPAHPPNDRHHTQHEQEQK